MGDVCQHSFINRFGGQYVFILRAIAKKELQTVLLYIIAENYSIYGVEIVLTRVLSPYILSVYLPSAMFVSMSWVTFNIHVYAQGE